MTITVLAAISGHVVVADIYNYLLLPILYSLCPQQALHLVMILYLVG